MNTRILAVSLAVVAVAFGLGAWLGQRGSAIVPVAPTGPAPIVTTPAPTVTYTAAPVVASESTATPTATKIHLPIVQKVEPMFYVATAGSNQTGDGSIQRPWATITYALEHVPDRAVILVRPGRYDGQVDLRGTFAHGVIVRSEIPYRAQLRHNSVVVTGFKAQGITLEGFDIAHSGPGADIYVIQIQDLRGQSGGVDTASRIVLRNNVLHDSYNNDIVKVNNGASQVTIENNIFYNQAGLDSHIDANSVRDVVIQDNIFFNDFEGSNRPNLNDTGSFIVIKDSNAQKDTNIGAHNIIVRRNVFFNWQGESNNTFIAVGEDDVTYFQAQHVLIENNLLLGNSPHEIRAPLQIRGVRDITFRHNTVVGDLPSKAFAMRLSRASQNQKNEDIFFYNNIWSDPTGTMGTDLNSPEFDFSDTDPNDTGSFVLHRNLYWNGPNVLPFDSQELINYTDDSARIISDPQLPLQQNIILPRWQPAAGQFADGSLTIRQAFIRLVEKYGIPATGSVVIDAADPAFAPTDDILGQPRPIGPGPDLGAVEVQP